MICPGSAGTARSRIEIYWATRGTRHALERIGAWEDSIALSHLVRCPTERDVIELYMGSVAFLAKIWLDAFV
jgi:hypothetical protein